MDTKDRKKDGSFVRQLVWVIIIFAAAAIFRLTFLDQIEFKLDEARDVYVMEEFWASPHLFERGTIQSTGVYNPPLWYYILAVLSLPSRDPQYLSFMIALINSLAVVGFYLVVRRFFGQRVGVVAALLLATSPWSILFSRKIWAPDIILPFVVVWFWCMCQIHLGGVMASRAQPATIRGVSKRWAWFGLALVSSLLAQIHASGIFLAVGTIVALIVFHLGGVMASRAQPATIRGVSRVKVHLGGVFVGLAVSLIPLLPYINYQIKTNCEDCRAFTSYQGGETIAEKVFDGNAFLRPFQFINGSGFQVALGTEGYQAYVEQYPFIRFLEFVFLLEFLLLPMGIWYLFSPRRSPSPPSRWVLATPLLVVPLLYFLTKTPAHLYYFLVLAPVLVTVCCSLGFYLVNPRGLRITLAVAVIIVNIIFMSTFYKFLGDVKVVPGDYGATFGVVKERAQDAGMKVEEYVISLYQREH